MTVLRCPHCGNTDLSTLTITETIDVEFRLRPASDGRPEATFNQYGEFHGNETLTCHECGRHADRTRYAHEHIIGWHLPPANDDRDTHPHTPAARTTPDRPFVLIVERPEDDPFVWWSGDVDVIELSEYPATGWCPTEEAAGNDELGGEIRGIAAQMATVDEVASRYLVGLADRIDARTIEAKQVMTERLGAP